jgi:hypothetical protein
VQSAVAGTGREVRAQITVGDEPVGLAPVAENYQHQSLPGQLGLGGLPDPPGDASPRRPGPVPRCPAGRSSRPPGSLRAARAAQKCHI